MTGVSLTPGSVLPFSSPLPPPDVREVLRYAGAQEADPALLSLLSEVEKEAAAFPAPRAVYRVFKLRSTLPFAITGRTLPRYLSGCDYVILLAVTAGHAYDRAAMRHAPKSVTRSLLFESLGSERVEAMCDALSEAADTAARAMGYAALPRVSPGYGDIPLALQRELFPLLACQTQLGMTLNESLLMAPKKSVTAFIGIRKERM